MKTVGVMARPELREAAPALSELIVWLRERGIGICLEGRTADLVGSREAAGASAQEFGDADVVVVLGGDGTLLAATRLLGERPVPVLGINFGSLGFLTEIALLELYPALEGVLAGKYRYEERRMLRAIVRRQGQPNATADVLNDVVVTKASLSRIIELDVTVDGRFVSAFRADGLIVSSPTGSTAYNLAAGGPILQPTLRAVVLTPICPHMLTNRPLVLGDESTIEVRHRASRDVGVHLSFDGQPGLALGNDDSVVVTRSPRTLRLVKAPGRDHFEVLRTKLKWGESSTRG